MAFRKQAKITEAAPVQAVSEWSIADLSTLYAEQRSSLTAQARRILRSDADANEIVQEAFLKFIMAAPELDSRERALAYLRTTVNNLCLNLFALPALALTWLQLIPMQRKSALMNSL